MSAQPRQQPEPPPPEPPRQRYSTETRLAIVETRWQDVIPTLATKSDLREATTRLQAETALVRKDIKALEERLIGKVEAQGQHSTDKTNALEERLIGKIEAQGQHSTDKTNALEERLIGKIEAQGQHSTDRTDALEERLTGKIEALDARLEAVEGRLNGKIEAQGQQSTDRIKAVEERLTGKMDAMMNKIIIRLASITVAAIIATGTIVTLIQKFVN